MKLVQENDHITQQNFILEEGIQIGTISNCLVGWHKKSNYFINVKSLTREYASER